MGNLRELSENIHNNSLCRGLKKEDVIQRTTTITGYFISDILKTINDIQKTSLNEDDANKRIAELSKKCGITIAIKINLKK